MTYVDGFVIPVPAKNIDRYREMAEAACKVWMKHGALQYVETVIEDASKHEGFGLPFTEAFKPQEGETIVFSYIVYKDKAQRDDINKKVMADEDLKVFAEKYADVFDCKRMVYSGFKTIVQA